MGFANCVVEVQDDFLADLHQYPFAHYALAHHLQFGKAFAHVPLLLGLVIRSLVQMFPIVASGVAYFGIVALFTVLLETMLAGYFSFRTVRSFLFEKKGEQE